VFQSIAAIITPEDVDKPFVVYTTVIGPCLGHSGLTEHPHFLKFPHIGFITYLANNASGIENCSWVFGQAPSSKFSVDRLIAFELERTLYLCADVDFV
jgi:hypothetical protein